MEQQTVEKPIELGKFKTKDKFTEFVCFKRKINLVSDEATITGDQLAMDLDGRLFKITIKDSGTVDFEEADNGEVLSDTRKQNLLDMICEYGVAVPARDRFFIDNYKFKSIIKEDKEVDKEDSEKDKEERRKIIELSLCVEVKKPIDKLTDILASPASLTEKQSSKLDSLLSFFDNDDVVETKTEVKEEPKKEKTTPDKIQMSDSKVGEESYSKKMLNDSLNKMKQEKLVELTNRLDDQIKEKSKISSNIKQQEKTLKDIETDIELLSSRLENMTPNQPANGFIFNVSEEVKHGVTIDDKTIEVIEQISPLLNLNPKALVEHLKEGRYYIRIAKKDNLDLCKFALTKDGLESMKQFFDNEFISKIKMIDPLGKWSTDTEDDGTAEKDRTSFVYRGKLKYHDLIEKLIKIGFEREHEFDKIFEDLRKKKEEEEEKQKQQELESKKKKEDKKEEPKSGDKKLTLKEKFFKFFKLDEKKGNKTEK